MRKIIVIGILVSALAFLTTCEIASPFVDMIQAKIEADLDPDFVYDLSSVPYRDMVSVTGGNFTQESDENGDGDVLDVNESFSHTISDFQLGQYEVTYELWYMVHIWALSNGYTFANPGIEGNDGTLTDPAGAAPTSAKYEPVTTINWRDAIVWCNAYSEMVGYSPVYYTDAGYTLPLKISTNSMTVDTTAGSEDNPYVNWSANGYRLPIEGEWQYAASYKDGTNWTAYNYASGATSDYNNATATGLVAWYSTNKTYDVGAKIENQLVIYDMSGNVNEWCWDWYGSYSAGPESDYIGPASGSVRVNRGGSWGEGANMMQLGYRNYSFFPNYKNFDIGFRLARGE